MRLTFCFRIVLLACSLSGYALSQTPADLETARALYTEARNARDAGNFKEALEKFRGAYAVAATPITAIDLARAEEQAGRLLEAREVLLSVARIKVKPTESTGSKQARAEAETLAEQVRVRIPSIVIQFAPALDASAEPPTITVDGAPVPIETVGLARKVNPGAHTILVTQAATGEVQKSVIVRELETVPVVVDLTQAKPIATVTKPNAGPTTTKPPQAERVQESRDMKPLVYASFGVAGAGVVLGTISGIVSFSKSSSLNDLCKGTQCVPAAQGVVSSGRTWATISTVSFVVAGLGAGACIVGLVLSSPAQTQPVKAGASFDFGPGSVSVQGRF
jgi:hypothetical protein